MTTKQNHTSGSSNGEFVISRVFDASPTKVWKAWTDKDALASWWGPKGFTLRVANLDLRPGGIFHYGMRSPDGRDMWGKFVYREVAAPHRLAFVVSFTDDQGNPIRHPMSATWPLEVLSTLRLEEEEGQTKLTMTGIPINATDEESRTFAAAHEGMRHGWKGTLDQLAAYLGGC